MDYSAFGLRIEPNRMKQLLRLYMKYLFITLLINLLKNTLANRIEFNMKYLVSIKYFSLIQGD
jgi:hypothetical protein